MKTKYQRFTVAILSITIVSMLIISCTKYTAIQKIDGKYDLNYVMKNGSEFLVTKENTHLNDRTFMGNRMVTTSKDFTVMEIEVNSSGKDGCKVEMEYEDRTHETDEKGFETSMDFSELFDKEIKSTLSAKGELTDFDGLEELPKINFRDMDRVMTPELYSYEFIELFPIFPDFPVGVDETWKYTQEFNEPAGGGILKAKLFYEYKIADENVEGYDNCLLLKGNYTFEIGGLIDAGGLELTVKLEGSGTEEVCFDLTKKMFHWKKVKSVFDGSAFNEDMGITAPMHHEIENTYTVEF